MGQRKVLEAKPEPHKRFRPEEETQQQQQQQQTGCSHQCKACKMLFATREEWTEHEKMRSRRGGLCSREPQGSKCKNCSENRYENPQ